MLESPEVHEPRVAAETRATILHGVYLFYGDGGVFAGDAFERWLDSVDKSGVQLYVGAGGSSFTFPAAERNRANEFFKAKKLSFAAITDNVMLRMLGTTARLVGVDLALWSWAERRQAFQKAHLTEWQLDELTDKLCQLREEVEAAVTSRPHQGVRAAVAGDPAPTRREH